MKKLFLLLIVCTALLSANSACMREEFTSNPAHTLSFSQDTISFDTVFTLIPSADKTVMIYNPNKKGIHIQSVSMKRGVDSYFHLNVDGMSGDVIRNIDIDAKDSIYVRVRILPDEQKEDLPTLLTDSVVITANGIPQYVALKAFGQNAYFWRGKQLQQDTTLSAQRPFIIYDSLVVNEGATLTLSPGTTLHFHADAALLVKGRLVSKGSWDKPVVMRGDRIDKLFEDLPYDYLAGQWEGIRLFHSSRNNQIEHTHIRSGNYGIEADSSDLTFTKLTLSNSIIDNVRGNALKATNCLMQIVNSQLSNAKDYCVYLLGGNYQFIHCTIANYYAWDIRHTPSVSINNFRNIEKDQLLHYPVENAAFYNTIIYGNHTYELELKHEFQKEEVDAAFHYRFTHCLLKYKKEEESNQFEKIVWNKDPKFRAIGQDKYRYDYRIDSLSAAIDQANPTVSFQYKTDLEGKDRMHDGSPDIGAYEFYPNK